MRPDLFLDGLAFALLGGAIQGAMLLPLKYNRQWSWENSWLGFSTVAYLVAPWILAVVTVPHLVQVLSGGKPRILALTFCLGIGWGVGNLLFGLGVAILGMGLGYTIIMGLTVSAGTLVPLAALAPEEMLARRGLVMITGVVAIVAGTAICSYAGRLREKKLGLATPLKEAMIQRPFVQGFGVCIAAGILAPAGNLALAFGSEIQRRAAALGTSTFGSVNALWAIVTLPLFLCSAIYALVLLRRNRTFERYRRAGTSHYWLLAAIAGVAQMAGIAVYGLGAADLGRLGPSIGFPLLMSSMIVVANVLGLLGGEWKGAGHRSMTVMAAGLAVLLGAMVLIGYGNRPSA
ncbi:MAG: L-rhamnose/proton symporter RhaT [Candidatus Acidiferrales bacterium]